MRDILFRGKRKDNGEWVYGYYFVESNTHYIKTPKVNLDNVTYYGKLTDDYEVIPETVGQYSGLNDENGKKIFEGDIILIGEKRKKVEVIFLNGQFGYLYKTSCISFQYQSPEVIGNIYDKEVE